ncbi:MAG: undecaprenyl-phosphate glucose phosphotransferase [Anaerolineae bacterium]|nr:undecaprenyl-phosphate glucose phosphotransferase [Anaerolineae bacterium]
MRSQSKVRTIFAVTLALTDMLMAAAAFSSAYWLRRWIPWPEEAQNMGQLIDYASLILTHVVSIVIIFGFSKMYHVTRTTSRVDEFYGAFKATSVGTLMGVALSSLLFKNSSLALDYSRGMILYGWGLTIILITVGRLIHSNVRSQLRQRGWGCDRVLIVGTGEVGRMVHQKIQSNPGIGYEVAGFVTVDGSDEQAPLGAEILGGAGQLAPLIEQHDVDEVIIALPEATHQDILMLLSECERGQVTVKVFPDVFQIMAGPVGIGDLGGLPLVTVRDIALRGWRRVAKRMMDVVGAGIGLVVLSPVMLVVAIMIKLDSPGPVFYVQQRMGLDARPFNMLKFRSMRKNAEANGPGWTVEDDPRVTRLGRFLRGLNVDELPQFINVLLGQMSLVGPRPERPIYVNQFRRSIPRYMDRHWEKAGLTGWAQVNGLRGDTSIAERTKYDLWYIENWSLLLDFKILIRTVFNIVKLPNAY